MMNPAAANPEFAQAIDADRLHTLLTKDVKRSGSLLYRYDDTQETVTVPNIWYNQPYLARAEAVRWEAQILDEQAERFAKNPRPYDLTPAAVAGIVSRYRARSVRIRAEADRMEAAGVPCRPVAASRMDLNYGENVFL